MGMRDVNSLETRKRLGRWLCSLAMISLLGCSSDGLPLDDDAEIPTASSDAAPETYTVRLTTTQGQVLIEVHREWSPNGADRFYELVNEGFYDGCKFFRVLDGFMAQVGINGSPAVMRKWGERNIPDDPVVQSNTRGYVTFAKSSAPNSRSTQIFFNYGDNSNLDGQGFSPFAVVTEGMDVIDSLYSGYGEGYPNGRGPDQGRVNAEGNEYLEAQFPKLDAIIKAEIVDATKSEPAADSTDVPAETPAEAAPE